MARWGERRGLVGAAEAMKNFEWVVVGGFVYGGGRYLYVTKAWEIW